MKLIITTEGNDVLTDAIATEENEEITLPDAVAALLSSMDSLCRSVIDMAEEAEIQELHDYMTGVFSLFIERIFPGRSEFGLSDAALIKAQDDIIKQAIAEGKSVEEAVKAYNDTADAYIQEIKGNAGKMS